MKYDPNVLRGSDDLEVIELEAADSGYDVVVHRHELGDIIERIDIHLENEIETLVNDFLDEELSNFSNYLYERFRR